MQEDNTLSVPSTKVRTIVVLNNKQDSLPVKETLKTKAYNTSPLSSPLARSLPASGRPWLDCLNGILKGVVLGITYLLLWYMSTKLLQWMHRLLK